jgi:hypothetical protein
MISGKIPSTFLPYKSRRTEMDLKGIGYDDVDFSHLPLDTVQWRALVFMKMNILVPQKARNFLASLMELGFFRRILLHVVMHM